MALVGFKVEQERRDVLEKESQNAPYELNNTACLSRKQNILSSWLSSPEQSIPGKVMRLTPYVFPDAHSRIPARFCPSPPSPSTIPRTKWGLVTPRACAVYRFRRNAVPTNLRAARQDIPSITALSCMNT